jgi:hypothetical protein
MAMEMTKEEYLLMRLPMAEALVDDLELRGGKITLTDIRYECSDDDYFMELVIELLYDKQLIDELTLAQCYLWLSKPVEKYGQVITH